MRPKNYIEEATKHANKLRVTSFLYSKLEKDSPDFRELVFSMATFALWQDVDEGRVFMADPEITKVTGDLLNYHCDTQEMRYRAEGQSDAS